jgi:hypothetical protein
VGDRRALRKDWHERRQDRRDLGRDLRNAR